MRKLFCGYFSYITVSVRRHHWGVKKLDVNPKSQAANSRQIVWVCLTILWGWHLKGYGTPRLLENDLNKLLSTSVLATLALCNCTAETRNHFINARVLFRWNNFQFNSVNFVSDHEVLSSYFIKRQEMLETGLFTKVIR